jgi:hypothetical protein
MGNSLVSAALTKARSTGQAVPIDIGNGVTLMAYPNGNVGSQGGGFGGQGSRQATIPAVVQQQVVPSAPIATAGVQGLPGGPSGAAVAPPTSAPSNLLLDRLGRVASWWGSALPTSAPASMPAVDDYGRPIPTVTVHATPQPQVQAPLNQANPNTTYVSPNTSQPAGAAPVVGQTDTQSGQPVHATYNMPPAPDTATAARNYRAQHGLATSADTDALNAESLAAAQAGRTSFNPTLAAQYGQPLAAGVSGPRTDVVNALTMPSTTYQAPQQLAQNSLLQQGIY